MGRTMQNETRQGKEGMRQSESGGRLTILRTAMDGFWLTDMDGGLLEVNDAYCRMSGYAEAELLGMRIDDLEASASKDGVVAHLRTIRERGEDRFETRHRRKDGTIFEVEVTAQYQQADGGRMIAFLRDITDQKQAREALRQNEAFTKAVLDNLPVGIAVNSVDPKVDFVYMNDNFPRFYRTTREKLVESDSFWGAVYEDPRFRAEVRSRVLEDCADGDPHRMHWENIPISRRGETVAFISAQNIPVPEKRLMISMVWDVTAAKRDEEAKEKLQAQLAQAQKIESVGRLAGGVAHDFNNMLGVILGVAELAMEKIDPGTPLYDDLLQIQAAGRSSAELTRQLLTFARKQTVSPRALDLNQAVEGMLKMLQRLIGEDIDLDWNPQSGLWSVKMDPAQLDQLLANLCVNARDAIADVGKITIETANSTFDEAYCADHPGFIPGDYVLLAVSDDGCGMDSAILDKIFEPFFTTKELGKGTGLGLATVYGIVKQNHGFINVYSEPDRGTTFKVYLSRHLGPAEHFQRAEAAEPTMRGQETVILVEDEPALLKLTKRMLERLGYQVLAASGPAEAIRIAAEHPGKIDLLMTDVVMPEMNGRDLALRLLSSKAGLKCLFMSGYTSNVIAHHGVLDKNVHFLPKPFSLKDLSEKIREVLA